MITKLARYGVIGGISTLIHLGIAFVWLYFIDPSTLFANTVGFLSAFTFSYTAQSKYVFAHPLSYPKAFKYFIVQFGALLIAMASSAALVSFNSYFKTVVIVVVLPLITFTIHRFWTFTQTE